MSDQKVRLQYSDDGGHTLSEWREESIGKVGEYQNRVTFDRLGQFIQRTGTIRCSSPCRRDLFGVVGIIKP